jgi:hypothetical protein
MKLRKPNNSEAKGVNRRHRWPLMIQSKGRRIAFKGRNSARTCPSRSALVVTASLPEEFRPTASDPRVFRYV